MRRVIGDIADGYHARTDGLTSLAVVAGAVGVWLGYPIADPLVGLLITVVILFVLKQATGQMIGRLMDTVEPELVDAVERTARDNPEVQDVSKVRVRWVGHALEASFAITVDCEMTVTDATGSQKRFGTGCSTTSRGSIRPSSTSITAATTGPTRTRPCATTTCPPSQPADATSRLAQA